MHTPDSPGSQAPLAGIRVLDLTRVLAGPFCTMLLADLGAEVVKIERPGGDDARHYGPFLPSGESAYFAGINRGKKSIVLDLKYEADRATFLKLVERADVVVENYRPGTMEVFGLAADRLREINPRLVYASVTGFGRTGPDARRPAYDVIIQALGGLMSITGHDADHPARVGSSISDIIAGVYTALTITAALARRERNGRGSDIDLAMLDCTVAVLENAISRYEVTKVVPQPLGTRHPSITPFQAFPAADGLLVVAAGNDALWNKFCAALDQPRLAADPRFGTNALRTTHHAALEHELNAIFPSRTVAEWLLRLDAAGIPAAPIRNVAQLLDDPQLAARDMWHTLVDGDGTQLVTPSSPVVVDGLKLPLSTRWPRLGENQSDVLRAWLGGESRATP